MAFKKLTITRSINTYTNIFSNISNPSNGIEIKKSFLFNICVWVGERERGRETENEKERVVEYKESTRKE